MLPKSQSRSSQVGLMLETYELQSEDFSDTSLISHSTQVFSRIRGIETEFHLLFEPVSARKMKIAALNNDFCLSVEVYRSDTGKVD